MLKRIVNGQGKKDDIELLLQVSGQMGNGMTICVFADAAIAPVLSAIPRFREEFEAYVAKSASPGFDVPASGQITPKLAGRTAEGMHS
jgi:NADH-quinone oxidoreductase subunit F